jgi:2-methylcitrate dehydratase PrpD
VNARLHLSASLVETDESGGFRWSALASHGYAGFGGAAACPVLGGWGTDMLTHAFGLVGWTAPTAKNLNPTTRSRFNSFKYAPYGAITQAGVIAAALAEEGYVGAARADWQFVAQKLSTYCAGILDSRRQSDLLRLLQELESVDDVAHRLSPLLAAP